MDTSFDELCARATKGDKVAQAELFSLGERFEKKGDYQRSANVFREAANSYRIAAYHNAIRCEDAEGKSDYQGDVRAIYHNWANKHATSNIGSRRHAPPGLTEEQIWAALDYYSGNSEYECLWLFLERSLTELGMEFYSPGGSVPRRLRILISCYLGGDLFSERYMPYLSDLRVQVCLDTFIDKAIEHAESEHWRLICDERKNWSRCAGCGLLLKDEEQRRLHVCS